MCIRDREWLEVRLDVGNNKRLMYKCRIEALNIIIIMLASFIFIIVYYCSSVHLFLVCVVAECRARTRMNIIHVSCGIEITVSWSWEFRRPHIHVCMGCKGQGLLSKGVFIL